MKFIQTPNFNKSKGIPKIGFVLHGTLGGYIGSVAWLCNQNRPSPTSAHYVIGRASGEVIQLVKNEDIAWHAGNINNPTKRAKEILPKNFLGKYKNPNDYFIGIEFVWGYDINGDGVVNAYDKTLTDWQYRCAVDIIKRSGIVNPKILSHKEICDYKGDDMYFAVEKLIGLINQKSMENSNVTRYEVINKETHEIYPVSVISFGEETVDFTTSIGVITFNNPDQLGQLTNEAYLVRQVGSHLEPDGTGTVEI